MMFVDLEKAYSSPTVKKLCRTIRYVNFLHLSVLNKQNERGLRTNGKSILNQL
jgi:hypothetical protein